MDRMDGPRLSGDADVLEHALALVDAAGRLRDADLISLSDEGLDELLHDHERALRVAAVVGQRLAAEVAARGLDLERGYTSTASYLRDALGVSLRDARSRVRIAEWTAPRVSMAGEPLPARYEALAAAQADGAISAEHVRVVASMLDRLPDAVTDEARRAAEESLTAAAKEWDPGALDKLATKTATCLDPDGVLAPEREKHDRRELSWSKDLHGMHTLRGRFDEQAMSLVRTVLDPLAKPVPGPDGEPDPRSAGQRRADAFLQVLAWQADSPDLPTTGGRKPQLVVTIGLEELQRRAGLGRLPSGDPVSVEAAVQLACDADTVLAVLRESGELLFHSRNHRLVPNGLRAALVTRDVGCTFPGCDRPAGWCVCHHITHWAHGGTTDITNCCLLCARHHTVIHDGEWTIQMRDGRPTFIPPKWVDIQQRPRVNHLHDPPGRGP